MSHEEPPVFKTLLEWVGEIPLEEGDIVSVEHPKGTRRTGPPVYSGVLQLRRGRSNARLKKEGNISSALVGPYPITLADKIIITLIKRKSDV